MINDIRLAPSELYAARTSMQPPKENNSEEFKNVLEKPSENNQEQNETNNINTYSFGAPAGFFADISMLNEEEAREVGLIQGEQINPYLLQQQ